MDAIDDHKKLDKESFNSSFSKGVNIKLMKLF